MASHQKLLPVSAEAQYGHYKHEHHPTYEQNLRAAKLKLQSFRNEKPGPGRFRQFMQFDADTVGAPGVQADAEMCMMLADVMEALGLESQYVVRYSDRRYMDAVMSVCGIHDEAQKLTVLRSIDKIDKFPWSEISKLLMDGRWDGGEEGEGDFTAGAGLDVDQVEYIRTYVFYASQESDAPGSSLDRIDWLTAQGAGVEISSALSSLGMMAEMIVAAGYHDDKIVFDSSVVRGLEYYTGPVYECELTFPVVNEKGQEVVFGSVAGGGRYDGLVSRFMGQPVPATGFSIGVSRLMTALKNLGKLDTSGSIAPVLVTVMDGDAMGEYQRFTQQLREAGVRAEMYQGNWKKFGNQLKYADRRGCPLAVIQGSDERANGKIQIKDLIEGRKQAEAIASNEEWRETRPGQFEINADDLVSEVKRLLGEQAGNA